MKKVGFLDKVHPVLEEGLAKLGFNCIDLIHISKENILNSISDYSGIVVRSRFPINLEFLIAAENLEFIARSGAGLENIDEQYCRKTGIKLFNAPEGNRNAVGEHALGMLLSLFNNLHKGQNEIQRGEWNREKNRGLELDGKTVGIIGFGNNGTSFAKKLRGFDADILAYDKYKSGFGNDFVEEVEMNEIFLRSDILSLHIPQTEETKYLVDDSFIDRFHKSFYLINVARGKIVDTSSLVSSLESGKILGACLDVLEFEKSSFEDMFSDEKSMSNDFKYLINSDRVVLSPHVAGWTQESYYKLSTVLLSKIEEHYKL